LAVYRIIFCARKVALKQNENSRFSSKNQAYYLATTCFVRRSWHV